jgi:hypothetical protein
VEFPSSRPLAAFLAIVVAGALMLTISPAQNATTRIDISRMAPGLPPDGFTFWRTGDGDVGEWLVLKDPTAISGQATAISGQAIAQTSKDPTDYGFPLAIYKPISAKNIDVVVRFKPVDGKVDQAGGIVVRLTTPDDYYVVRANALEDNVCFYRVVKGKREQITGADTKSPPTTGTRSGCGPRVIGSQSPSMGSNSSPPRTIPSPDWEKWRFGLRPTV